MRKGQKRLPVVPAEEIRITETGRRNVTARCPWCTSFHTARHGEDGTRHTRKCMSCGRTFCVNTTAESS